MGSYMNLKVTSTSDSDLNDFLRLCSAIHKLGLHGASRTLKVNVDGDGSGFFKFELLKEDGSSSEEILPFEADVDDIEDIEFSLGE